MKGGTGKGQDEAETDETMKVEEKHFTFVTVVAYFMYHVRGI